ncbi:unnamed protein product [Caenorhabditis brenneri]
MSGFPFFYLPHLAFEKIFSLMDLETLENQDDGFSVVEHYLDRISNFFSPSNDMIDLEIWNKDPELNEVMISSTCSRVDRVLEQILKASKDASVVRIYCEISENLRVPSLIQFNSTVERLVLKHAKWVTRHNLADIFWKVELLTFGETNFQKSDFIWFFTKWVEGSIIQNAKLPLNGFPLGDWIENVPTAVKARIRFYSPKSEKDSVEYETYTIRQASGHVAVLLEGNGFVYLSTKQFQLL